MSSLSDRTRQALQDGDKGTYAALLIEWMAEAPILGNLHRARALNGDLLRSQERLIGAVGTALMIVPSLKLAEPDERVDTMLAVLTEATAAAVKVP